MATIKQKILDDHTGIMSEPDPVVQEKLSNDVGKIAVLAMKDGIRSRAWADYMRRYVDNSDQLKRLCGEDDEFNKNPWAERCLAYIVSNTICTFTSRRGEIPMGGGDKTNQGTLNYMDDDMLKTLNF